MSTTNHYVTTKRCCFGWGPGVKKLNGVIEFGNARQIHYDGRPFLFCPWCGKKIVTERVEWLSGGA